MSPNPGAESITPAEVCPNPVPLADAVPAGPAEATAAREKLLAEIKRYESVPLATLMAASFLDHQCEPGCFGGVPGATRS